MHGEHACDCAGSSFYITVEPPENTESKPEDGAKCLVHLQDPDNGMTLFDAQWDAQQVAFVADLCPSQILAEHLE